MMGRRESKVNERHDEFHHRLSCVNSSDILTTARNALDQYPRFSFDGKDAMYHSSFRSMARPIGVLDELEKSGTGHLPTKVAGENVVWCKPGVVGKLMGLDTIPVPMVNTGRRDGGGGGGGNDWRQKLRKKGNINKSSNKMMMAAEVSSDQVELQWIKLAGR